MNAEQMLSVIAIIRAYATNDAEGFEAMVKDAPETGYGDLIAFCLMILEYHHGDPVKYLDGMANGVLKMHVDEIARSN